MSILENLKAELKDSFNTLLGIGSPDLIDEETSLAYNKTVRTKLSGLYKNSCPNKTRELMDAIAAAIDSDEEKDDKEDKEAPFKLTKRMSSQKLLFSKKANLPSVSSLVVKPFSDRDVLAGEEAIKLTEMRDLSSITGKDVNRSLGSGLFDKASVPKLKKKSLSKNSMASLSRMGSVQSIVNSPITDDFFTVSKPNVSSLGITAKDLYKSFDDGLENALEGKDQVKKVKSIVDAINAPLNEEYGSLEEFTVPLQGVSLKQSVASLINGDPQYFIASQNDLKKSHEDTAAVSISIEDPVMESAIPLNVPQHW